MANEHNPFAGGDDPFNDPSVKNAAAAYGTGDAYNNPFEGGAPNPAAPLPHKQSAYEQPKAVRKPTSPTSASTELKQTAFKVQETRQSVSGVLEDDLAMREQVISRRETQIAEREKELEAREKRLGKYAGYKPPNWPCECWALTYHNINEEVPEQHRPLIRKFYAAVLWCWVCILWNWVTIMVIWVGDYSTTASSDALWSSIFFVGIPASWKVWYRPIYDGVRESKAGRWIIFFLFFLCHMVFAALMALGVPNCAASGLFYMIKMFGGSHSAAGIMCLITLIIWALSFLSGLYLMKAAHGTWKRMGGEEEMQKEIARRAIEGGAVTAALNTAVQSDAV